MKSPLWLVTSALTLLLILAFFFIVFTQKRPKAPASITPEVVSTPIKRDVSKINLARIYENDLFNTYIKAALPPIEAPLVVPVPPPPLPRPAPLPQIQQPQFLPPLDVTLKGIIFVNNDQESRAIIANNKTKQETLYRVGDKVEDADIIRISKRKVIVLRSNGQQETLFMTHDDAVTDSIYTRDEAWTAVVKPLADTIYAIDPKALSKRIGNLAEFIEMLDMTTAFDKGKSLGCRIGRMSPQSIGHALGLQFGDIIMEINTIPTTTTHDRVAIYSQLKQLGLGATIVVKLLRNNQEYEYTYVLQKIMKQREESAPAVGTVIQPLGQAPQFTPVVQDMKNRDKGMMLRNGGRKAAIGRSL